MRLLSLEVAGFRGFATKQTFDFDADAVIVIGANGNGKTSLFDAILWAISGRIPRLGSENALLSCMFSEAGQARVVLGLGEPRRSPELTISRVFDSSGMKVSVETQSETYHGPEAEGHLIRKLWKEAAMAADPSESLALALTRSVYLQQDCVRDFIGADSAQDRFTAISELVGAGRVTDLQGELERAKKLWTTATNNRSDELQPSRSQLATMQAQLAELSARSGQRVEGIDESTWAGWWEQNEALGLKIHTIPMTSREAPSAIDDAIKQIDATRRAAERKKQVIGSVVEDLRRIGEKSRADLALIREKIEAEKQYIGQIRNKISAEQDRVAEVRRLQSELKEKSEQLRALAEMALKHLGEKCPICEQEYDYEATRTRLELLAAGNQSAMLSPSTETTSELLATLTARERGLSMLELEFRNAEQTNRELDTTEISIERRLNELDIERTVPGRQMENVVVAFDLTSRLIDELEKAQKSGELLALRLAGSGELARIEELQREIGILRAKLHDEDAERDRRTSTGSQAQTVIEALREAASRVVTDRVEEIEPLLNDIYSRIDVHPAFRAVRLLTSMSRGRGQLNTLVVDPQFNIKSDAPGSVLSSSQMNALAVCTFLALNLGVSSPPFDSAILDDPLQSLDDINLLGLIDLLRRTKDRRQLFVSTHDARFGELLSRKLRPGSADQRTIVIELNGWSRSGPTVTTRKVDCDPEPFRLVAVG